MLIWQLAFKAPIVWILCGIMMLNRECHYCVSAKSTQESNLSDFILFTLDSHPSGG